MQLTLYIDFKSPASYLALQPTLALLAEYPDIATSWQPLDTRQRPVPEKQSDENRSESHVRVRAEARRNMHLHYAAVQGVPMKFRAEPGETRLALAALCHCATDPLPYIQAAYTAYWRDGADLNDADTVQQLLKASACPELDVTNALSDLDRVLADAAERGIIDAPAFWIQEQLFIGREHLPWIRELLAG